ncbi:MAG: hypothetical protein Kow0089_11950 [Desulfobulbaceae bacterium]
MTLYTRDKVDALMTDLEQMDPPPRVFLIFGERFLCRQAADRVCQALTENGGTCHMIDGDAEDFSATLNRLASFSLFPGRQVYRVNDTKLFHSIKVAGSLWKKASRAREEDKPREAARYLRAMLEAAGLDPFDPESDPGAMSATQWKKLFGFSQPQEDLGWTGQVLADQPADRSDHPVQVDDAAALLEQTLEKGLPSANHLVLLAEEVDRRKRIYKYLTDKHVVVDMSVETGSSSKARSSQKEVLGDLLRSTLSPLGKKIAPGTADLLFERVGFHPVALVMEAEKLALYVGDRERIEKDDLDAVIGRTRQEAVFELTDAIGKRNLDQALLVAGRLIDNGVHPLAIVATVKNHTRTLLLFRALQEKREAGYLPSMQPGAFQKTVLPTLKEVTCWTRELSGHPYALFMQFKTASTFSLKTLRKWMDLSMLADFRLKGSPVEPLTVIHHLLISMLSLAVEPPLQNKLRGLH